MHDFTYEREKKGSDSILQTVQAALYFAKVIIISLIFYQNTSHRHPARQIYKKLSVLIGQTHSLEARVIGVPGDDGYAQVAGQLEEVLSAGRAAAVLLVIHQIEDRRHVERQEFLAQRVQYVCGEQSIYLYLESLPTLLRYTCILSCSRVYSLYDLTRITLRSGSLYLFAAGKKFVPEETGRKKFYPTSPRDAKFKLDLCSHPGGRARVRARGHQLHLIWPRVRKVFPRRVCPARAFSLWESSGRGISCVTDARVTNTRKLRSMGLFRRVFSVVRSAKVLSKTSRSSGISREYGTDFCELVLVHHREIGVIFNYFVAHRDIGSVVRKLEIADARDCC